ncbi:MAG: VOC family protein [Terriglobia bacterium]
MPVLRKITPCLWFDDQAEQARLYRHLPKLQDRQGDPVREGRTGDSWRPDGFVSATVVFELEGQSFTALNGGRFSSSPRLFHFKSTAVRRQKLISLERLSQGGDKKAQQCGWLAGQVRGVLAGRS